MGDRIEVAIGASNPVDWSVHRVDLDPDKPPICPNMSDGEFRSKVMKLRDDAVILIDRRLAALQRWDASERLRVADWFGMNDDVARSLLITGLSAVNRVLRELKPKNFVRQSPELDRALGCVPHSISAGSTAHVCAPTQLLTPFAFTKYFATFAISQPEAIRSCQRSFTKRRTLLTRSAVRIGNIRSHGSCQSGGKKIHS